VEFGTVLLSADPTGALQLGCSTSVPPAQLAAVSVSDLAALSDASTCRSHCFQRSSSVVIFSTGQVPPRRVLDSSYSFNVLSLIYYYLFTAFSALTPLVGRQEGHLACKKTEWWGAGVVICLERRAGLHMAQLMPLPLTVSCFSKIQ